MAETKLRKQTEPWITYTTEFITGCPYGCGQMNIKTVERFEREANFTQKCCRCKEKYKVKGRDSSSSFM